MASKGSAPAKKAAAKKATSAAKKVAAKKSAGSTPATTTRSQTGNTVAPAAGDAPASTVTDRPPDAAPVQMTGAVMETPEAVAARETLHSRKKWGTGRDRDARLRRAGMDPAVVARERNRLRREERDNQS